MERYELQRYIQDAEHQIIDLSNQIRDYERKIAIYQKDYAKLVDMQENMQNSYKRKQADIDLARVRAKGIAMTSYIAHLDKLYGYDQWRNAAASFENMEEVIQDNIRQAQNIIEGLQGQITSLENHISIWQNEIYQIDRQENINSTAEEKTTWSQLIKKGAR